MIINILPAVILVATIIFILLQRILNIKDEQNLILALLGVILAFVANFHYLPDMDPAGLNTDFLGRLAAGGGLAAVIFTLSLTFGEKKLREKYAAFSILLLTGAVGLIAATASLNLLVVFIGLELICLSCYFLSTFTENGYEMEIFHRDSAATVAFLGGMGLFFLETGTLELEVVTSGTETLTTTGQAGLLLLIIFLFIRSGIIPFHKLQLQEESRAVAPAAFYISIVPRIFSFVLLFRLTDLFSNFAAWRLILTGFAGLTIILGSMLAYVQKDPRRMLAYSSVVHSGLLLAGLTAAEPPVFGAVIYFLFLLLVMNTVAYGVIYKSTAAGKKNKFTALNNLGSNSIFAAPCAAVAMLSLAGFITTGGFTGRFYLLQTILADKNYFLLFSVFAGTIISLGYYLQTIICIFSCSEKTTGKKVSFHPFFYPGCLLATFMIIYAGLYPNFLIEFIRQGLGGG